MLFSKKDVLISKDLKVKCRAGGEELTVVKLDLPYTDEGLSWVAPQLKYPDDDHQLYSNPVPTYKG